jgi:F-type H+-transporting ATPase subunit a
MKLTPDQTVLWKAGFVEINLTLVYTWAVMALIVLTAWITTRGIRFLPPLSRMQHTLEIVVSGIARQIEEIGGARSEQYLPFIGTLFLFILFSNVLAVVPGFLPPTASLNTALALAACVFIAVPFFGIKERGLREYLKNYIRPSIFLLPFNIIGEVSRTLALAVRLFGNMMSGSLIVAILLLITPLLFPVVMQLLGLITGVIQAYIFAVLAMVYIVSATQAEKTNSETALEDNNSLKDKP